MNRRIENVNSRFFGGVTLPGKLRYQYLGSYTKFDHFLSKIKEQINMIRSYYIYLNDQTLSLQKEIIWKKNLFVRKNNKAMSFSFVRPWNFLKRKYVPTHRHEICNVLYKFEQYICKSKQQMEKKVVASSRSFFLNINKNLCSNSRCDIYYKNRHARST